MIYGNPDLKSQTSHNFLCICRIYQESLTSLQDIITWYTIVSIPFTAKTPKDKSIPIPTKWILQELTPTFPPSILADSAIVCHTHIFASFMRDGQKKFTDTRPHTATVRIDWGKTLNKIDFNYSLNGRLLSKVKTNIYNDSFNNPSAEQAAGIPGIYDMGSYFLVGNYKRDQYESWAVNNLFDYAGLLLFQLSYHDGNQPDIRTITGYRQAFKNKRQQ